MRRSSDELKNVERSVRDRLFNVAKAQGRDFQSVLKLYFLERFLYRLSVSRFREGLLLKGALLFVARADPRSRPFARPTKDIDLEATVMQPDLPGSRPCSARSRSSLPRRTAFASTPSAWRSP